MTENQKTHEQRVAESLFHKYHILAQQMRDDGYAVVFWTPEELKNLEISNSDFEENVTQKGNDLIAEWEPIV